MTNADANKLFTAALKKVESDSIRRWARAQRKTWAKIVRYMDFLPEEDRALKVATKIVVVAIGA